jgi:hypothetical protein
VIISGPPFSAKTLILDVLSHMQKITYRSVYMESNSWEKIFRYSVDDIALGYSWKHGLVDNAAHSFSGTSTFVLKFDGVLSPIYGSHISQYADDRDSKRFIVASFESIP